MRFPEARTERPEEPVHPNWHLAIEGTTRALLEGLVHRPQQRGPSWTVETELAIPGRCAARHGQIAIRAQLANSTHEWREEPTGETERGVRGETQRAGEGPGGHQEWVRPLVQHAQEQHQPDHFPDHQRDRGVPSAATAQPEPKH